MTAALRLSVLDQSPISQGSSGPEALRNTLDLARLADERGYHRYWVAEHHGSPMLAGPSPEALIGMLAAATTGIRVGSGGVLLPYYSPFKVAETFSVLSGLFPGRIDLGVGRAAGTDPITAFALQRDRRQVAPDDFAEQLPELLAVLDDALPEGHPLAPPAATLPGRPESPEVWLLGSSAQSAVWAAQLGLPYAFADFINPDGTDFTAMYRERFVASRRLAAPRVAVAAAAICAETAGEADVLASSIQMAMRRAGRGRPIRVPPVERALLFMHQRRGDPTGRRIVTGAPAVVRAELEAVASAYGADEAFVVTITHEHAARRRSYELIAEAFALAPRGSASPGAIAPAG